MKMTEAFIKPEITRVFDPIKYLTFLALNLPLVLIPIVGFLLISKAGLLDIIPIVVISVIIVFLQYPVLLIVRHWLLKTVVFYFCLALFLFSYGIFISWGMAAGGYPAGSVQATLYGATVIVFFGHIFGGIFFPFIVLINWLVRRLIFVYEMPKHQA